MIQLTPRDTSNVEEKATYVLILVKIKINLSLSSLKHHIIKTYWGVEVFTFRSESRDYMNVIDQLHAPADSPIKMNNRAQLIGGVVDPRLGVDAMVKSKSNPSSCRPDSSQASTLFEITRVCVFILRNVTTKAVQTMEFDREHYLNCNMSCHDSFIYINT